MDGIKYEPSTNLFFDEVLGALFCKRGVKHKRFISLWTVGRYVRYFSYLWVLGILYYFIFFNPSPSLRENTVLTDLSSNEKITTYFLALFAK